MLKRVSIVLVFLFLFSSFSGCKDKGAGDVTNVMITSDNEAIAYHEKVIENGDAINSEVIADIFKALIEDEPELVLVKEDEAINIDFGEDSPKKITLYDHYINEFDGTNKFGKEDAREISSDGNTYSFKLGSTSAELFESDLSGYKYRGLRLRCKWDHREIEYAFVVKTVRYLETVE